ncbi:MAG: hypothetical protein U0746_22875 [Gemmataceae bacterium]
MSISTPPETAPASRPPSLGASIGQVAGIAVAIVAAVVAWAVWQFGSIAHAAAYARGERVVVEPAAVDFGAVAPNASVSQAVTVTNLSGQPVCILGGNPDCACRIRERLPLTIPAGDSIPLHLGLVLRSCAADGKFDYLLYTDARPRPLRVSAVWQPKGSNEPPVAGQ